MGRAFEYRKATKLKRWGHMAKTFTKIGKQIAIAVKAGGPEPENNPALRACIANAKRENMPKDNIERAIKNAMGKDQSEYKEVTYEGYGPHGIAIFVDTLTDNTTRRPSWHRHLRGYIDRQHHPYGGRRAQRLQQVQRQLGHSGQSEFPVRPQGCVHLQEEGRPRHGRDDPRPD